MSQQQFSTLGLNHFQLYNFEILNYTSLNFARPSKPTDSHTASMTAERRKLFDQLPRLNTNVAGENIPSRKSNMKSNVKSNIKSNVKSQSNESNASNAQNLVTPLSPDHDKNEKVTPRVKFVIDSNQSSPTSSNQHRRTLTEIDVTAETDDDLKRGEKNTDNVDNVDSVDHIDNRKKKNRLNQKVYRRASAPAQGIDYYFKNAKQSKMNSYYYNSIKKNSNNLCIPSVHVEADEPVEDDETDDINHNQNMNSTSMSSSVSSNASCNPPSLSPCSSNSSLSSSVDMCSPAMIKQSSFAQTYNNNLANPLAMKPKAKTLTAEIAFQGESHSLPDIVDSPYGSLPWSPAAMYLSNFANSNIIRPKPDDEGQQVGEYILGKVIGRGGFSTVKLAYAMDQYSGSMNTVAVKIVRNLTDSDDNDHIQALLEREIAIWRRLDHPNIVRMLSVVYDDYATFAFSEYCSGGTLLDYIKKHSKCEGKGIDEDEARNIFLEVAEAMRYLHNDMRLVHKDIKLDNILLDDEDTWKICDFGLTEFQNSANGFNGILYSGSVGGSIAYCAPEQLRSPIPLKDPSVDVWSLGVVLFAMVTGQLPFSDSFEPRLQFKIINGRYDESLLDDSGISNELRDLLRGMFKTKPDQRLTISQVLEHEWCER